MFDPGFQTELRTHKRVRTAKPARLAVQEAWYDCTLCNISGGGAFVEVEAEAAVGTAVMLRDEDLGLIAATVTRCYRRGFAVSFGVSEEGKRALIDRLTLYLNRQSLS